MKGGKILGINYSVIEKYATSATNIWQSQGNPQIILKELGVNYSGDLANSINSYLNFDNGTTQNIDIYKIYTSINGKSHLSFDDLVKVVSSIDNSAVTDWVTRDEFMQNVELATGPLKVPELQTFLINTCSIVTNENPVYPTLLPKNLEVISKFTKNLHEGNVINFRALTDLSLGYQPEPGSLNDLCKQALIEKAKNFEDSKFVIPNSIPSKLARSWKDEIEKKANVPVFVPGDVKNKWSPAFL
jgi:hypothetical protein